MVDEDTTAATTADLEIQDEPFGAFFQREFVKMVALAEAVSGDPSAAEDLAADAMTRASNRWTELSGYDKPGAWLRRVTINLALDRKRRAARQVDFIRRHRRGDLVEAPPDVDHPVWAAVARLPRRQRAAVALFYIEDLPVAQIAEVLECAVSTATSHLQKGRARLAELLEEGGDR